MTYPEQKASNWFRTRLINQPSAGGYACTTPPSIAVAVVRREGLRRGEAAVVSCLPCQKRQVGSGSQPHDTQGSCFGDLLDCVYSYVQHSIRLIETSLSSFSDFDFHTRRRGIVVDALSSQVRLS